MYVLAPRRPLLAVLLLATACAYGAEEIAAPKANVPGTEAHRIDEPVFGGQMIVYEAGRGNAREILLVHGIGEEAARDFRDHIAWLQKSFHVVAVDLPGFGASDKANVLYSPGNYARVLKHVAGGNRNREIAARLFISEETVKVHVKHIMDKLGAKDCAQAIAIAVRRGIIEL